MDTLLDPPYNQFYYVLKFVDQDTILGKAFFRTLTPDSDMLTFSMSRKYPFEFMDEADHEILYNKMKKPTLESMAGIWEGQLVSDSAWTEPVFSFRYYFDDKRDSNIGNDGNQDKKILNKNYLFGRVIAETARVEEKDDHLDMYDLTGNFHEKLRQLN
ncbi:MAG: hypothetical protein E6K94_11525 [Thaumarchaeota archaeon]|nr:MAG: hypothetical protein E6K94_11525 [Nitrososphaerota archaeon]